MPDFSAFVLAGGRSRRMGSDKAFLQFEGRTLLAQALDLLRALTPEVRIVGPAAKFATYGRVIEDVYPGHGPLAGIHAALSASTTELNLILAVDLPFVSESLLRFIVEQADAAMPWSRFRVLRAGISRCAPSTAVSSRLWLRPRWRRAGTRSTLCFLIRLCASWKNPS